MTLWRAEELCCSTTTTRKRNYGAILQARGKEFSGTSHVVPFIFEKWKNCLVPTGRFCSFIERTLVEFYNAGRCRNYGFQSWSLFNEQLTTHLISCYLFGTVFVSTQYWYELPTQT